MTTYETIYLMNETGSLIGQALMDMITVIFTIIAAALFGGHRLTRTIVIGIAVLSAAWVLPMLRVAYDQLALMQMLAQTLTPDRLGELTGIAGIIGSDSFLSASAAGFVLVASHGLTWVAAVWFLNHSRKQAQTA